MQKLFMTIKPKRMLKLNKNYANAGEWQTVHWHRQYITHENEFIKQIARYIKIFFVKKSSFIYQHLFHFAIQFPNSLCPDLKSRKPHIFVIFFFYSTNGYGFGMVC